MELRMRWEPVNLAGADDKKMGMEREGNYWLRVLTSASLPVWGKASKC